VEWFVCANAAHGLGAVFVPMYEKELQKTWQYIIQDAAIKYLFVRDQRIHDIIKSFQKDVPSLKEIFILFGEGKNSLAALEQAGKANPGPSYKSHWSETAFIIYTSGTTGDPKGVLLHHGNMSHAAQASVEAFYLKEDQRALSLSFPGRTALV
jgi:long-chain acyl-CoA synthetase